MTREANAQPPEFERLKALLVGPESDLLQALSLKVDGLDKYVGTAPHLEIATAEIIARALRRAEVERHRELANALSPLVVSSIRSEIRNSRDAMVEALYPITGRLVAAAVAAAFRDLNARIDRLTSLEGSKLRLRALLAGKPVRELALAQTRARLTRVLFLERGSGTLVATWQADGLTTDQPEMLSGLIAAITEFANTALGMQGGELRTLDLGTSRVILRMSPRMIIAANCEGALLSRQEVALDAAFLDLLERHDRGDGADAAMLAQAAATAAAEPAAAAKSSGKGLYVAGALIAGALAWWGGSRYLAARHDRNLREAFSAALAADPELSAYPLQLGIDRAGGRVLITGLAPDLARVDALAAGLRGLAFPRAVVASVAQVAPVARVIQQESAAAALYASTQETGRQDALLRRQTREELAGLQKAAAQLEARLGGGLEAAAAALRVAQDGAAAAAQRLAHDRAGRDAAGARLRSDVDALGPRLAAAEAAAGQLRSEVAATAQQLADARAALGAETAAIRSSLELGDTRGSAQERQLAMLSEGSTSLRKQLETVEATTARLRAEIEGVAPAMRDVKSTIARETGEIKSGLGERDARAADIQAEIAALQKAAEALRTQLEGVSSSIPAAEARALADSEAKLAAERRRLEAAARAIDAGEIRMEGIIGNVSGQAEKISDLAAKLEAAEADANVQRQRVSELEKTLAAILPRILSPEAQLKIVLARSAVYFVRDTVLDDEAGAFQTIGEIAALARQTGASLRVIGHTDDKGAVVVNLQLALKRANFVTQLLTGRGVDAARVAAVSRGSAELISETQTSARALNRRVTFEFANEADGK